MFNRCVMVVQEYKGRDNEPGATKHGTEPELTRFRGTAMIRMPEKKLVNNKS